MNKKIWTALTLLSSIEVQSIAIASDLTATLSLEQAIQEGVAQSPSVQRYSSQKDEAHWGKLLGLSGLLPHVDLTAKHDFSTRYKTVPVNLGPVSPAVPIVFPRTSLGVEANWTIFNGLANINTYRASLSLSQASDLEFSRKEYETRKKIELAFVNALAARKFQEVAEENVKTLQENAAQARNRLKSGVATQYDVLRVEVQLSDATTELERTQDNVQIERKKLAEAMGATEDSRALTGQLPIPSLSQKVAGLAMPSVEQREDFRAAELRTEAAERQASAQKGSLLPAVGLVAAYDHYENTGYPNEAYAGFRDSWNIGVAMRWSILDGGASIARTKIARAHAESVGHEYQEVVQTMPADFELWKRRYVYSEHRYGAKKADLARSEESYRIAQLSFQEGRKTITDVLDAEADLFRSRAGVVQSLLDAEEALVKLELTVGKEI